MYAYMYMCIYINKSIMLLFMTDSIDLDIINNSVMYL